MTGMEERRGRGTQPPSPHNVRNTGDCCSRATEGWRGVKGVEKGAEIVDALGLSMRVLRSVCVFVCVCGEGVPLT